MAGGRKKYLFDTDFGPKIEPLDPQRGVVSKVSVVDAAPNEAPNEAEELPPPAPTYDEDDLARAREEGFQDGHTAATRDLTSALEQRLANTMDAINAQVSELFETYKTDRDEHSRDAVAVATVIVRKLFPALNMDKAMDEIEHMIIEAMQRTSGAPELTVQVPAEMKDAVEGKVVELAALRARAGTVSVMSDPAMTIGEASIEWDGGGMVRDSTQMWRDIDQIIERNLGTERNTQAVSTETPNPREPDAQELVNDPTVGDNKNPNSESAPLNVAPTGAKDPDRADPDVADAPEPRDDGETETAEMPGD